MPSNSYQDIENQRTQDAALQAYLDLMSQLLLKSSLRSKAEDGALTVAQARTITVFLQLDRKDWNRKGVVVRFLYEASLVQKENPVISLTKANLRHVNLERSDLSNISLSRADLYGANLAHANLSGADLSGSNLRNANLSGVCLSSARLSSAWLTDAKLIGANLRSTDLSYADLSYAYLRNANLSNVSLERATLAGTDLSGANLRGSNLSQALLEGAYLREAKELTQEQIEQGIGARTTQLPEHVQYPVAWTKSIEEPR